MGFCGRTIKRHQKRLGLVEEGQAPFQHHMAVDGTEYWTHHVTRPQMSTLSDDELDIIVGDVLNDHPRHGRTMLCGALASRGLRLSQERIRKSYERVHGPPRQFGRRSIPRSSYYVPGANSCWHHDGNHSEC